MVYLVEKIVWRLLPTLMSRMSFDGKLHMAAQLLEHCGFGAGAGVQNSNETAVFWLLKRTNPVLVDVGAHTGEYAQAFLASVPNGKVFCIEPVSSHFEILSRKFANNHRVSSAKLALGEKPGRSTLFRNKDVSGLASFSRRRLEHLAISMQIEEEVTVSTLDTFASEHGIDAIDLLKIDVEGHELSVLRGAAAMLSAGKIGIVQFEFGGCNLDSRTTFQDFYYFFVVERGFSLYVIHRSGLQRIERYSEMHEQYRTTNFVAVRNPSTTA